MVKYSTETETGLALTLEEQLERAGSMTLAELRNANNTSLVTTSDGTVINVGGHPGDQWSTRAQRDRESIVDAWEGGEPVESPDVKGDAVRRYPRNEGPDLLLAAKDIEGTRYVTTVLYADTKRVYAINGQG